MENKYCKNMGAVSGISYKWVFNSFIMPLVAVILYFCDYSIAYLVSATYVVLVNLFVALDILFVNIVKFKDYKALYPFWQIYCLVMIPLICWQKFGSFIDGLLLGLCFNLLIMPILLITLMIVSFVYGLFRRK